MVTSAPSAVSAVAPSAHGEALATLPPMVPALRIWAEPTCAAARLRHSACSRTSGSHCSCVNVHERADVQRLAVEADGGELGEAR